MKRAVVWTWAAEMDAQAAFVLLEDTVQGSGLRLVAITEQLLSLIQEFPYMAPVWRAPLRKALLGRTYFGLFYAVEPGRIVITGLQDLRRDPELLILLTNSLPCYAAGSRRKPRAAACFSR